MFIVLDGASPGHVRVTRLEEGARVVDESIIDRNVLSVLVASAEAERPRWVWNDSTQWYPLLLAAGVTIERVHDLRLCHRILRLTAAAAGTGFARADPDAWDSELPTDEPGHDVALFDALDERSADAPDAVGEFVAQRACLDDIANRDPAAAGRLKLLLAAESSGALVAEEMRHHGLPWNSIRHNEILTELLGPRPRFGGRPAKLEALASAIREALGVPGLNPDSQPELLRALKRVGLPVASTSKWELLEQDHPVVAPLLEYKKLARLLSANGWAWMDAWIREERFHPEYVVGGVVTGRWATRGGGALQLPAQVRGAVRADPGWRLVVADAAQLEPRIIAAMARDDAMATAGRASDLYQGLVDAGVVDTRAHAKLAMLGALYGSTTGESARLMPRLTRAYPRAIALVEEAARAGERGEQVSTWLGRSSPLPGTGWQAAQQLATTTDATALEERRARQVSRDWGRFTRNFVAQGTAAEWALCWMAGLRLRLRALAGEHGEPRLVFFMHDEVVVHAPAEYAEEAERAVREAAEEAGRLLFGRFPVEFALEVAIVESYAEAK